MYGRSSSVPGPNSEYGGAGGSCKLSRTVSLPPPETRCEGSKVGSEVVSHCSPSSMAALFVVVFDLENRRFKSRRDGPDVLPPAGLLLLLGVGSFAFSKGWDMKRGRAISSTTALVSRRTSWSRPSTTLLPRRRVVLDAPLSAADGCDLLRSSELSNAFVLELGLR